MVTRYATLTSSSPRDGQVRLPFADSEFAEEENLTLWLPTETDWLLDPQTYNYWNASFSHNGQFLLAPFHSAMSLIFSSNRRARRLPSRRVLDRPGN